MVRMREGLELPCARRSPFAESKLALPNPGGNPGEESGLAEKGFGHQAGTFSGFLKRRKVDLGSDVLLSRKSQNV